MDERSRAVGMLKTGKTQRDVAERFRVSQSVISRLWNRYLQAGNCQRKPKSGRPRCTTGREDRYLVNVAKSKPLPKCCKAYYRVSESNGQTNFFSDNLKQTS